MMQSMAAQSPWIVPDGMPPDAAAAAVDPTTYVAWHIRTSSGETSNSFNATRHRYIFHDQRAEDVFPPFLTATVGGEDHCPSVFPGGGHDVPIYISSNRQVVVVVVVVVVCVRFVSFGTTHAARSSAAFIFLCSRGATRRLGADRVLPAACLRGAINHPISIVIAINHRNEQPS